MHKLYITAELRRVLAVVKVTSQINGNIQFSGSRYQQTSKAIKIKFGGIDYIGEGNPQPTFCNDQITGGFFPLQVWLLQTLV